MPLLFASGDTNHVTTSFEIDRVDLAIIVVYMVGIVALGCWAGIRKRRGAEGSAYFLAGKSLRWPLIGLALFATNISTIHLVSLAQSGYTSGLLYGNFEWMAGFTLVILSLFFAPFYIRANVATLPDFLEKRFSRGSRDLLALLSIYSAIVVHIGFSLYTGALVLEGSLLRAFSDNPEQFRLWTIIAVASATALYTIVGGLMAVVLTESIQTIVLLGGAICITLLGLIALGTSGGETESGLAALAHVGEGWEQLKTHVHPNNMGLLRPDADPTALSWYAVFLGYPVAGIWYWCTDQTIVQRVLGAKDEHHARVGPLFAGFIKILPIYIFVLPGLICLALINQGTIDPLPTNALGQAETGQTYSHLITTILPVGARGIVLAALLAALMSTVSGALNSIATLVSYDIFKRWRPDMDDHRLVIVGRVTTFVAMVVAIVWSLAITALGKTIFQAMVDSMPVVAPPTAVVFVWGVFWRKASAKAALITLISGGLIGGVVTTLILTGNNRIGDFEVNSLLALFLLAVLESFILVGASYLFPHKHTAESEQLVWKHPLEALQGKFRGVTDYRLWAGVLVAIMVFLYWWFAGGAYYPVEGRVLLADGSPVVGAELTFECDDPSLNFTAVTGADGRYAFGTPNLAGGAPAGTRYRVSVVPKFNLVVPEPKAAGGTAFGFFPAGTEPAEEIKTAVAEGRLSVLPVTELPSRYADFATSKLACEIKPVRIFATKKNRHDFELAAVPAAGKDAD